MNDEFDTTVDLKNLTYDEKMSRLEEIVLQLEEGKESFDKLSVLVEEATQLIMACRVDFAATESNLNSLLNDLDGS